MGIVDSKTFKSGKGVAVSLPDAIAFAPGTRATIERHGDAITIRRVLSEAEEAGRLARFREAIDELKSHGPLDEVAPREPIEFPDRPGL